MEYPVDVSDPVCLGTLTGQWLVRELRKLLTPRKLQRGYQPENGGRDDADALTHFALLKRSILSCDMVSDG